MTKTIDITPSWAAAVEIYIAVLENPSASPEGRGAARSELQRLARAFDDVNAEPEPEITADELNAERWRAEQRYRRAEQDDTLDLY